MRNFLVRLSFFSSPLLVLIPVWIFLVKNSNWSNYGFLQFQAIKLIENQNRHFNTIYIGDSSGGNALSTENNPDAINLCLTGDFGYNGLITYLDLISEYITYDTIVVMNTLDVPGRLVNEGAYWLPYLYSKDYLKRLIGYIYSAQYANGIFTHAISGDDDLTSTSKFVDYPISPARTKEKSNTFGDVIHSSQLAECKRLETKLKESKKKFYFLFGPSLPYSHAYHTALCDSIKRRQIRHVLNLPYLLNEKSKGNAPDHVHPSYRELSTRYYREIIKAYQAQSNKTLSKPF